MSSSIILDDIGVRAGIFGRFHGSNLDPRAQKNLYDLRLVIREISSRTNTSVLLLDTQERDGHGSVYQIQNGTVFDRIDSDYLDFRVNCQDFSGAVIFEELYLSGAVPWTFVIPTCDHPVVGVRYRLSKDKDSNFAGFGAARVDPWSVTALIGPQSIIHQMFGHGLSNGMSEVNFFLSAGIGPCCLKVKPSYVQELFRAIHPDQSGDMVDDDHLEDMFEGAHFEMGGGISLLTILEGEARRCAALPEFDGKIAYHIHRADSDCTACVGATSDGAVYNSGLMTPEGPTGFNLAFFASARNTPKPWR